MIGDRRLSPRWEARENYGRLEWSDGDGFRETRVTLTDISRGGARIVADEPPPLGRRVWVRLEEPAPTDWIAAMVVRLDEALEVGLVFSERCPFDLFGTATLGIGFGGLG